MKKDAPCSSSIIQTILLCRTILSVYLKPYIILISDNCMTITHLLTKSSPLPTYCPGNLTKTTTMPASPRQMQLMKRNPPTYHNIEADNHPPKPATSRSQSGNDYPLKSYLYPSSPTHLSSIQPTHNQHIRLSSDSAGHHTYSRYTMNPLSER